MRHDDVSDWGTLVFEIMSQQTPVTRVQPIWLEWMRRWPTPADLAAAETDIMLPEEGPLGVWDMLRTYWRELLTAIVLVAGANTVGYALTSYMPTYLTATLHYDAEHGNDVTGEAVDEDSPRSADTARSPQGKTTDGPDPGLVDEERTAQSDETDGPDPGLVDTPDAAEDEEDAK